MIFSASRFSSNIIKASALAAACLLLPAAAMADGSEIKTGRYAMGPGANLDSFTCASTAEDDCKALFDMKDKLTREEQEHLGESGERAYLGDFVVAKEPGNGDLYSVKGGIFIGRVGAYTFSSRDGDKALCQHKEPNKLVCSVYDEDKEAETVNESTATLTFAEKNKVELNVAASGDPEKADVSFEELLRFVDGQTFTFETEEEYAHDMFISAKLGYLMNDANLNKKWKSLDKKVRDKILPEQRKWIKDKDENCGAVTMKGSEKELTEMYNCQKEMTADRLYYDLMNL
ncbi:lysozyme inhibitor LprI family protein [Succinimonas sp.]|uniref:lysozyme inhibitor LprI family protein n=1 Tax=Succinimonas sp. TaxID=1936151 RepID=UPI00386BE4AE